MKNAAEELFKIEINQLKKELAEKERELEIEAALERVRSRTMAMHRSDELTEVAELLFKQVSELGIPAWTTGFNIWSEDNNYWTDYVTNPNGGFIEPYTVDTTTFHVFKEVSDAKKRGEKFFVKPVEGEVLKETYQRLTAFAEKQYGKLLADGFDFPEKQIHYFVFGSKVSLMFITYEPVPEADDIFKRFAKVFEQTYTRFLDLQKAEAQAREAQIQLALERVRARTMAMQHSNELGEAANLLFKQVHALCEPVWSCGYNIWEINDKICTGWMSSEGMVQPSFQFPLTENPTFMRFYESREKGETFYTEEVEGEQLIAHYQYMLSLPGFKEIATDFLKAGFNLPESQTNNVVNFESGNLIFISNRAVPEAHDIFKRFAKVFEQTYTRFLDLQKAEAQAKEARIEAALERVRSRSMAMHKSEEVMDVAVAVYDELQRLDFKFGAATIIIMDKDTGFMEHWLAGFIQKNHVESYQVNNIEHPLHAAQLAAWRKGEKFVSIELFGTALADYAKEMFTQTGYQSLPDEEKAMLSANEHAVFNMAYMRHGALMWAPSALSSEKEIILQRFAKVFEQTYTRFLDLKKAEAQAREAQIEVALEKVRSRSLAMHKSEELQEVIIVVFEKLKELGLIFEGAGIQLFTEGSNEIVQWVAAPDHLSAPILAVLPYTEEDYKESEIVRDIWLAKEEGKNLYNKSYSFNEKNIFFKYAARYNDFDQIPIEVRTFQMQAPSYTMSLVAEKHSALWTDSYFSRTISQQGFNVLKRTAKVFEQAYTRFLDLQKAEAQAREAMIEAALERVRAGAMAMHTSEDLTDVVKELRKQIGLLGQIELDTCVIQLYDESLDYIHSYASLQPSDNKDEIRDFYRLTPKKGLLIIEESLQAYSSGQKDYILVNEKGKSKQWMSFMKETYPDIYAVFVETLGSKPQQIPTYWSLSDFNGGSLLMVTIAPPSDVSRILLRRFANVFGLAYRRFKDLKQAEAQAREAQIETALERVRSRSLAMHKSDELRAVVAVVFEKLNELDFEMDEGAAIIIIFSEGSKDHIQWIADPRESYATAFKIPHSAYSIPSDIAYAKENGTDFFSKVYPFEEKNNFFSYLFEHSDYKHLPDGIKQMILESKHYGLSIAFEKNSAILIPTRIGKLISGDHKAILKRFGKVFEQAYVRFLDLQKAEAQSREAQIEAALEKIRSRSLAMQRSDELKDVVAVLFDKLKELGLVFDGGAGIHLFTENSRDAEIWVRSPEVVAPVCSRLPYDEAFANNPIIIDVWKAKDTGKHIINKTYSFQEKNNYFDYVFKHNDTSVLPEPVRRFIKNTESYTATFISEKNSLLGANSWTRQLFSESDIMVFKRVAKVFEQAYVRFLDLQKAEAQAIRAEQDLIDIKAARKKAEDTLTELRATQQQLIQKEKMASLGELTAGIAHEIQNPLNFVNNFSEVNQELIEELKNEKSKVKSQRDEEQEIEILNDISQNLEKIALHGKRADAIVKGMLQHSMASTCKKEPTDINALADEYLRLSYHGLRAKDKSFNATIETHFDESIGKIEVLPQDIGRVLLNLFNNAFYAVTEMKKKSRDGYEPTVSVSTKRENDKVAIAVRDNGIGIPRKVVDKIFQPFFTTKPTGQGTGLGLSLSYDIVKAHGGELKVETREGEGAEFIVILL